MNKKCMLAILLVMLCQQSFAETCPSIKDIKNKLIAGWKAYDSDEGTRLSGNREVEFKNNIEEFALAEWVNHDNKTGAIHCYYRDKSGSALEAYLAKEHFTPKNLKNYWYEVSGAMHCAAGMENCEFEKNSLAHKTQLARE